jgi:hypothetical protein
MLDSENRVNAAQHFLNMARSEAAANHEFPLRWSIQAAVIFSVSATEVLPSEYAKKVGRGPQSRERKNRFRDWLRNRLGHVDMYTTMDNERNLILHPGEPDKIIEPLQIRTNDSANRVLKIYFPWSTGKSADEICAEFIRDIRSIIDDAKNAFAELNS